MCLVAPPRITRQPTNQMITALQDVTFTCEAEGFNVKYEWKRREDNSIVGNQSTFTIHKATPLDDDRYYCVAMTEGGSVLSNNARLRVNGKDGNSFVDLFLFICFLYYYTKVTMNLKRSS